MNIKRIGLIGGSGVVIGSGVVGGGDSGLWSESIDYGLESINANRDIMFGSMVHIGTGGPVRIDGNMYIGRDVYIEQGFDSRDISGGGDGNSLWKLQTNMLVSQGSDRSIVLGSKISIGLNNLVELDENGITIRNDISSKVRIGTEVSICKDRGEALTISSSGILVYSHGDDRPTVSILDKVNIGFNVTLEDNVFIQKDFNTQRYIDSNNDLIPACIPTDSSLSTSRQLSVNIIPQSNGNIKIGDTLFMPATPSGDPMHYAYEAAGAKYNDTTNFIITDAPWKDMVDTIEDKAKWGFDIVDASQVKQMTIGGITYNYVKTTRLSPEGTTEPMYFLVGQASDGTWVEDETKVLHLSGHWYLNGLGDITKKEMNRIHNTNMAFITTTRGQQDTKARTCILNNTRVEINVGVCSIYSSSLMSIIGPKNGILYIPSYFDTFCAPLTRYCYILRWNPQTGNNYSPLGNNSQIRVFYLQNIAKPLNVLSKYLSKSSVIYMINNAIPTTSITIALHADRYAQLSEDADIIATLEAKNTALESTGGSISLVSA